MARRTSLTSQLYRAARLSNNARRVLVGRVAHARLASKLRPLPSVDYEPRLNKSRRLVRSVRDSCANDRTRMVSNGCQRSTDLTYKQDFREDHLAARGADLHSQRGSRRFESAHLHGEVLHQEERERPEWPGTGREAGQGGGRRTGPA
jgi:hypothetical protein